jgi:phage-related protein
MLAAMADDKPLVWLHGEVKTPPFSRDARIEAGFLLRRLQRGENVEFPASRPMPGIGQNCHELRIEDRELTWRIAYHIDSDAIVILEVFEKKSRKTPKHVLDSCERRLRRYQRLTREDER